MLHYEDAAAAAIGSFHFLAFDYYSPHTMLITLAALHAPLREQIYLACDDEPVTRSEICQAVLYFVVSIFCGAI